MARKTLGAGIIGAGVIFQDHARAYTQLAPKVRLIGLADVDPVRARRSAQNFFVPFVTGDYHELLKRDDIDIVSICTPPSMHERMVIDALEAGKYVLCEKPLAHNLASADRIIAAAAQHPNRLSVVYQQRYSPDVLRTQWLISEGHLGDLQFGGFTRIGSLPLNHRSPGSWWGNWEVAGGGALITQCIHELDLAVLLFGRPKRVISTMATLANPIQSEDTITATVQFESGALVSIACCLGHEVEPQARSQVMGSEMAVHFPWSLSCLDQRKKAEIQREAIKRFPGNVRKKVLPGPLDKIWRLVKMKLKIGRANLPTGHTPCVAALLKAIEAGGPLPMLPEEARRSLELCFAIYTAAITGEPVEFPLRDDSPFYAGVSVDDYQPGQPNKEIQSVHA